MPESAHKLSGPYRPLTARADSAEMPDVTNARPATGGPQSSGRAPLRDADIRRILLSKLYDAHGGDANALIIEEWSVCDREARADVAVVNGALHAYEIKSEKDSLARLRRQVDAYGRAFERATLVTCRRHLRKAKAIVPKWWGIVLAAETADGIRLDPNRPEKPNPRIDPYGVAMFLWRHEALRLLESLGLANGVRSKPVRAMLERLAARVPVADLAGHVRQIIRDRGDWLVGQRQLRCDAKPPLKSKYPNHPSPFSWLPFSEHTRQSARLPN